MCRRWFRGAWEDPTQRLVGEGETDSITPMWSFEWASDATSHLFNPLHTVLVSDVGWAPPPSAGPD
jgi:hypothetical protein